MANGTSFEIDIDVPAGGTLTAADAVARLEERLKAAGAASTAAADAVKAGEAAYRQAEATANRAAAAVEKIGIAADAQRGKLQAAMDAGDDDGAERAAAKLQALIARQAEAAEKAQAATTAMNEQAASLDRLKSAADEAAKGEEQVAKSLEQAEQSAKAVEKAQAAASGSGQVNEIAEGLGKLGGPLASTGQKALGAAEGFKKLQASLGSAGPYVALAVVIVALATAIVTATIATVKWAVSMSDAARSQRLLSDGIAGTVEGGRELDATIASLEKRVPQTTEELRSMAADLAKTGLKGQALSDALEESATKAAKLKWGPDFAKGANTLAKLSARLEANIGRTFGALNIEPLLEGFARLVDLFDDSNASGRAMKAVFNSLLQALIDGFAALLPKARTAFIQIQIWIMTLLIAIKPFGSTIMQIGKLLLTVAGAVAIAIGAVVAVFLALWAAQVLLLAAVAWLATKFYELIGAGVKLAITIGKTVADAFNAVTERVTAAIDYLTNTSLEQIGRDLIQGLADGIKNGAAAVIAAITGVVDGAIGAAKSLLGIASPSKVFAEIGVNTAAGMAGGVEAETGAVQSSLESMVSPPEVSSSTAGASHDGGGSGGVSISGNTFVFQGVKDAEDAEVRFEDLLTRIIEGDSTQLGGAEANA